MKYAICNETFEGWEHARVCARVAELGYTGLELAPFTLASRITDVSAARRSELRKQAEASGVKIIGLHWLLAKTEGLHLTSRDESARRRTSEYLAHLTDACADLGGTLMVFGSPAQRSLPAGLSTSSRRMSSLPATWPKRSAHRRHSVAQRVISTSRLRPRDGDRRAFRSSYACWSA